MTSPDGAVAQYSATTLYELQETEEGGTSGNTEMWQQLEGIRDSLLGMLGGFVDVGSAIGAAITNIVAAITSISNGDLIDLSNFFGDSSARLAEIEASIANLELVAATYPSTPAYVAGIQDMATGARQSLVIPKVTVTLASDSHSHAKGTLAANTSTGVISGSTATDSHTHTATGYVSIAVPTYTPTATSFASNAPVDYTPIVVDRRGTVDKIRWIVGADTSIFSIDAYYIALCVYNPDNGNVEKVWDSGNIKDGVSNTSSLQEVELSMGISQECTPGQILYIAHQQIAPGLAQTPRSFAYIPQGGVARPSSLAPLDGATFRTASNQTSIPSSYPAGSLSRINTRIPWGAVSVIPEVA